MFQNLSIRNSMNETEPHVASIKSRYRHMLRYEPRRWELYQKNTAGRDNQANTNEYRSERRRTIHSPMWHIHYNTYFVYFIKLKKKKKTTIWSFWNFFLPLDMLIHSFSKKKTPPTRNLEHYNLTTSPNPFFPKITNNLRAPKKSQSKNNFQTNKTKPPPKKPHPLIHLSNSTPSPARLTITPKTTPIEIEDEPTGLRKTQKTTPCSPKTFQKQHTMAPKSPQSIDRSIPRSNSFDECPRSAATEKLFTAARKEFETVAYWNEGILLPELLYLFFP